MFFLKTGDDNVYVFEVLRKKERLNNTPKVARKIRYCDFLAVTSANTNAYLMCTIFRSTPVGFSRRDPKNLFPMVQFFKNPTVERVQQLPFLGYNATDAV